jgi:hypothetical protein
MKRRYVHTKTNGEHQGINFEIQEDGKVKLTTIGEEYDEIVVPASLIFKLGIMLKATRKVVWMEDSEVKNG